MITKVGSTLFAAALLAAPLGTAMAQQNNPTGNLGSNKSITASPGTADSKAASGMNTADSGPPNTNPSNYSGSSMSSNTPGGTGQAIVPGSTSSQASSSTGTAEQKAGSSGGGSK